MMLQDIYIVLAEVKYKCVIICQKNNLVLNHLENDWANNQKLLIANN